MEELTIEELELELLIIDAKIEVLCQTACLILFDSNALLLESLNVN